MLFWGENPLRPTICCGLSQKIRNLDKNAQSFRYFCLCFCAVYTKNRSSRLLCPCCALATQHTAQRTRAARETCYTYAPQHGYRVRLQGRETAFLAGSHSSARCCVKHVKIPQDIGLELFCAKCTKISASKIHKILWLKMGVKHYISENARDGARREAVV